MQSFANSSFEYPSWRWAVSLKSSMSPLVSISRMPSGDCSNKALYLASASLSAGTAFFFIFGSCFAILLPGHSMKYFLISDSIVPYGSRKGLSVMVTLISSRERQRYSPFMRPRGVLAEKRSALGTAVKTAPAGVQELIQPA